MRSDILKKIRLHLSKLESTVKLAQMPLADGTIIEAESFEKGFNVFVITEDEPQPLSIGEYLMEDGAMINVVEEGIIDAVMTAEEVSAKDAENADPVEEVEAEKETVKAPIKKTVEATTKETYFTKEEKEAIELKVVNLEAEIVELKAKTEIKPVAPIVKSPVEAVKKVYTPLEMSKMTGAQKVIMNLKNI